MSFFRYPGGKAKLREPILNKIEELVDGKEIFRYVEPFFGGGSICFAALRKNLFPDLQKIIINDADNGITAIWQMVVNAPDVLIYDINNYTPVVEDFYKFKDLLTYGTSYYHRDTAFMKLAVHQMSYSGLGTKAGGPIGGKDQSSEYDVTCRWSPKSMSKKIRAINSLLEMYEVQISNANALTYLNTPNEHVFFYLDPPYYVKGDELYQHTFSEAGHKRLAETLKGLKCPWLLSYDDCPEIRELYKWACIEVVDVNYTIRTARPKKEVLIYPPKKDSK